MDPRSADVWAAGGWPHTRAGTRWHLVRRSATLSHDGAHTYGWARDLRITKLEYFPPPCHASDWLPGCIPFVSAGRTPSPSVLRPAHEARRSFLIRFLQETSSTRVRMSSRTSPVREVERQTPLAAFQRREPPSDQRFDN